MIPSSSMVKHQEHIWFLLWLEGMQIAFNTPTGRSYLCKHMYLRTDYPKLARKPHLFRILHVHVSPITTLEGVLETAIQRSDIYSRNCINCVLVQYENKKSHLQTHRRIQCAIQQLTANISNNYSCREIMDLFITGFGAVLLPVRFMRLNRKDLHYPLSSSEQT